jgi:predicted glycosyltransferase
MPALEDLYEQIWVYGLPEICDPLEGLPVPASVRAKMRYTGYLKRSAPTLATAGVAAPFDEPYLLVTPGGGGDGETMIDWVISAYETTDDLPWPALLVFGPFMSTERQAAFAARCAANPRLQAITFDAKLERLVQGAAGVVAMGGYNTFCEILSFDKKALIVPRTEPRLEQFLRAERAQQLGLACMLENDEIRSPHAMIEALRRLPYQPVPSARHVEGLLDGLDQVNSLALGLIDRPTVIRPSQPARRHSRPSA